VNTALQPPPQIRSRRRIRILLVISDLTGGGAERQLSILLKHLSRERFEPHLCVWREVYTYPVPDDVPIHIVRKTRPWHAASVVRGMRRLIDELEPDLVYSQLHYVNMLTGTALARSRHQPAWVCRQCNDPRAEMKGPFAVWARWALRRADRVIGLTRGLTEANIDYLRVPRERAVTVYNLAELDRFEQAMREPLPIERKPDVFTVVHAGRLHPQKDQKTLLAAFARFRGAPAELWMLGEGALRAPLMAQAEKLGIASQVRWLGFVANPFPYFRAADCYALSSVYEGLPNTLIESMACGTPAVSTRCPYGPEELIEDGVTGLLVPTGNAAAFGAALERFAADREATRRMGAAAHDSIASRFGIEAGYANFERLFETVVEERMSKRGEA
jgi:glycosyltransferase involved in cell wall biosynthesis